MQRLGAVSVGVQRFDERLHLEARAAEHERRRRVLHVEHALERGRLVGAGDDVGHLADARELSGRRLARAIVIRADRAGAAPRSGGSSPGESRKRGPSAVPSGWPRGSPRGPRRSPCRASRRPRRGRGSAARPRRASRGADGRARAPGSRPRCRRRASARGSAGPSRRRRRAGRRAPVFFEYLWTASASCMASSRVGTRTRPRVAPRGPGASAMRWSMGSAKAAVFPVPVSACPRTSLP